MDFLSHFLWTFGIFFTHEKNWIFAIVGVLPDLLSLGPEYIYLLATSRFKLRELRTLSNYTSRLYDITHSLVVFSIVFGLSFIFFKDYIIYLLPWVIHILMDLPFHSKKPSYNFLWPLLIKASFSTRFLWPFSNFSVDGINWTKRWFIITNYSLLMLFFILRIIEKY